MKEGGVTEAELNVPFAIIPASAEDSGAMTNGGTGVAIKDW